LKTQRLGEEEEEEEEHEEQEAVRRVAAAIAMENNATPRQAFTLRA
jgi:hypothetical protein